MILSRAAGPAREALRLWRRRPPPSPWESYLTAVEPVIGAQPRVHRFAVPPLLAEPGTPAVRLSAWIHGDAGAAATADALQQGTVAPKAVLTGSLSDALGASGSDHLLIVPAGDVPAPLALERLGQALTMAPDARVVTCDEDVVAPDGTRSQPHFRPGPSPDRWLACDDSSRLLVVSRRHAGNVIGDLDLSGDWSHELAVRLAGAGSEHHAHVPMLLCHRPSGPHQPTDSRSGVARALHAIDPGARLEPVASTPGVRRVRRSIRGEPAVDIIVCLRDKAELTARCVDSVLRHSAYENLAVRLVDNGSVEPATAELLGRLSHDPRVTVRSDLRPFNFAALNNAQAAESEADVLVFLNNDTELLDENWLEPLLEEALRPEVGAVAPLLLFDDDRVQHAGAALGMHGYAGHPFAGLAPEEETPFGRADGGTRNWLAVTAACMMVERRKFAAVGGFDEEFVVAGNDVDLCLRLTAAGHRSLCVPHVRLRHHESRSRGVHIDPNDFAASERSYGAFRTIGDPLYNPNLTVLRTDCSVRTAGEGSP